MFDGSVVDVDFVSDLPAARVEAHAARVLSLDVDARGLADVGARDPVIARLLEEAGGRRPVLFGTPFEAAVWAVLSQRVSMAQAGRVKEALAAELGTRLEIGGEEVVAFPGPAALAALDEFAGLWPSKLERIRGLAAAALEGDLDPARLRALELDDAMAHLESLPGIGPFAATLVLARGAGHPDVPPPTLRRFRQAVASAYGARPRARRGRAHRALRALAPVPRLDHVPHPEHLPLEFEPFCGCGEIGIHAAFRSPWGQPRGGSSPLSRITQRRLSPRRLSRPSPPITSTPRMATSRYAAAASFGKRKIPARIARP